MAFRQNTLLPLLPGGKSHGYSQYDAAEETDHRNTFALSLTQFVIKSLALDLQILLNFAQTCRGCSRMLDSLELPWQVAVKQEFWYYPDLDITTWIQTRDPTHALSKKFVSALHRPSNEAPQGITLQGITLCSDSCYNCLPHTTLRSYSSDSLISWSVRYLSKYSASYKPYPNGQAITQTKHHHYNLSMNTCVLC